MKKLFALSVMFLVLLFSTNIFAQVSFSAETEFTVGVATTSLTNADVNGDGKQDIIATRQVTPKKVTVLLNTTSIGASTPTFSGKTDFEVGGANTSTIAIADLEHDPNVSADKIEKLRLSLKI